MSLGVRDKSLGALIVVIIVGLLIGGYLNTLVKTIIPGKNNVVKTFFTTNIKFGVGDFGDSMVKLGVNDGRVKREPRLMPLVIDLYAIKFQLGFEIKISFMSLIGLLISLYIFRWYR